MLYAVELVIFPCQDAIREAAVVTHVHLAIAGFL